MPFFARTLVLVFGLCLMANPLVGAPPNARLRDLADRYWDATMRRYPTRATALGDYRFNDRLEDHSEPARKRWNDTLQSLLTELRRIPKATLPAEDRLTHTLLERALRDEVLRLQCLGQYLPLDPLDGPHIQFPLLLVAQPFRNADDFRAYLARLRAFPRQITDIITNLREGMRRSIVSPRVILEKVIPQIRSQIVRDVTGSAFYAPVKKMDVLHDEDRRAITADLAKAIRSDVVPAYLQLLAFVEDEYLPACRSTVGIGDVEGGPKIYEALIYLNTTVSRKPQELHQLGLSEVKRIRGEMAKIQAEVGYDGSLDDFLRYMRTDPKFRFHSGEELRAAANNILQRTKPLLPELFGRLPKANCIMKEMEAFRAKSAPVAYYNPAPEDGSRPGYYYINTYAPQKRLRFTLEALSYHESIPGHHLQITLDQENKHLPRFRRYGSFTAYVEGWALYAEKLGYEIGGYRDVYARFGQLTFEMWRACRLVVDTGLHAMGWPRQKAIDFLAKNTSLAPIDIEAEVDRYISWPGQALAYKVGELRILAMRKEAEETLGEKFDLRAFHDALLAGGAMPIDILEKRMHDWALAQSR